MGNFGTSSPTSMPNTRRSHEDVRISPSCFRLLFYGVNLQGESWTPPWGWPTAPSIESPLGVCYERGGRFVEIGGPRNHPFPKKDPLDFLDPPKVYFWNTSFWGPNHAGIEMSVWNTLQPRFCVVPRPQNRPPHTVLFNSVQSMCTCCRFNLSNGSLVPLVKLENCRELSISCFNGVEIWFFVRRFQ